MRPGKQGDVLPGAHRQVQIGDPGNFRLARIHHNQLHARPLCGASLLEAVGVRQSVEGVRRGRVRPDDHQHIDVGSLMLAAANIPILPAVTHLAVRSSVMLEKI